MPSATVPDALAVSPLKRRRKRLGAVVTPYFFLAPFLILFLAFFVAPLAYALYTSVFRDTLVGGRHFVAFANYVRAFADEKFWGGVSNLLLFGVVQVPLMLGLALLFGVILDRGKVHAPGLFRL